MPIPRSRVMSAVLAQTAIGDDGVKVVAGSEVIVLLLRAVAAIQKVVVAVGAASDELVRFEGLEFGIED